MQEMLSSFASGEYIDAPSRSRQKASEDSFQTKKELYSIYLQEARLRRELETPTDDDKPNPLGTYKKMEHELAERRKFFSFNGLTRCKSLPSIVNPGLQTQKQEAAKTPRCETALPQHTPSIKKPLFTTRATSSFQELAQSLRDISDPKKSVPGLRTTASCSGDDTTRKTKHRALTVRRTKSESPRTSRQRWKIAIHRRLPTII